MKKSFGFTLIEVIVSVAIIALILVLLSSFIFQLNFSSIRSKADREVLENTRRMLDQMTYEIKSAKSVYVPTTTASQLSLETLRYLPAAEQTTFIDFFICGTDLCLKKEGQNPIALNPDTIAVTALTFSRIANGANSSIKISLSTNYKNPGNDLASTATVTLDSTVSLRNY